MDTVLSRYEAEGQFRTYRNNQRPYRFRGFFTNNKSAGYVKNSFAIMTSDFRDNRGVEHKAGTVFFNGPEKDLKYNIDVDEFFDRFDVTETNLARRKKETRAALRVTDELLNQIVAEERKSGIRDITADSVTIRLPWDGSEKKISVGDFIISHRMKKRSGSVQQQYIPVDKEAFTAIYIQNDRNIRSARRRKASDGAIAMPSGERPNNFANAVFKPFVNRGNN